MARERKPGKTGAIVPAQSQAPAAQAGAGTGSVLVVLGAAAMTTRSQTATAASGQAENSLPVRLNIAGATSIKLGNSELLYVESFLPDADQRFARLKAEIPWSPETVKMFGKPRVLRRETCNFGDNYDYNPDAKPAIEWDGPVLELKKLLEKLTGRVFTQCACNLYPDGDTGIGLHYDKRHPLLIASVSFGAVRKMGFAPKGEKLDKSLPMVPLASGSLLLFTDAINENYKHTIVGDKSVRGPRISVTFRQFADDKQTKAAKQKTPVAEKQRPQTDGLNPAPAGMSLVVDYAKYIDDRLQSTVVADDLTQLATSVASLISAYGPLNCAIYEITNNLLDRAAKLEDEANTELLPRFAHMQSLLSQRGELRRSLKSGEFPPATAAQLLGDLEQLPGWTEWYRNYCVLVERSKSLRSVQRALAKLHRDRLLPEGIDGNDGKDREEGSGGAVHNDDTERDPGQQDHLDPSGEKQVERHEIKTATQLVQDHIQEMFEVLDGKSVKNDDMRVTRAKELTRDLKRAVDTGVLFLAPSAPAQPEIVGEPVPEPDAGTFGAMRQHLYRMADVDEMAAPLETFVDGLLRPLLEQHPYVLYPHITVTINRKDHSRIAVGDWVEWRGRRGRLVHRIGQERSLGKVVAFDKLNRPRIRWHNQREWMQPYSLFDDSSVRVLFPYQAAELYPHAFASYPTDELQPEPSKAITRRASSGLTGTKTIRPGVPLAMTPNKKRSA